MSRINKKQTLFMLILMTPSLAQAYVGPGLGLGTIVAILGVLGSIFLALFAVLWYPLKRLFKKKKTGDDKKEDKQKGPVSDEENLLDGEDKPA